MKDFGFHASEVKICTTKKGNYEFHLKTDFACRLHASVGAQSRHRLPVSRGAELTMERSARFAGSQIVFVLAQECEDVFLIVLVDR